MKIKKHENAGNYTELPATRATVIAGWMITARCRSQVSLANGFIYEAEAWETIRKDLERLLSKV